MTVICTAVTTQNNISCLPHSKTENTFNIARTCFCWCNFLHKHVNSLVVFNYCTTDITLFFILTDPWFSDACLLHEISEVGFTNITKNYNKYDNQVVKMLFCTKLLQSSDHTTAHTLKCVSLKILRGKCDMSMKIALARHVLLSQLQLQHLL